MLNLTVNYNKGMYISETGISKNLVLDISFWTFYAPRKQYVDRFGREHFYPLY